MLFLSNWCENTHDLLGKTYAIFLKENFLVSYNKKIKGLLKDNWGCTQVFIVFSRDSWGKL